MKICSKCKQEKPFEEFHKRSGRKSQYASHCKSCRSVKEKTRYEENKERILSNRWKYVDENRDIINEKQRNYNLNNKSVRVKYTKNNREKLNSYQRNKRKSNYLFSLADNARRRINYAFNVLGYKKNSNTEKILGCSFKEFCEHIEQQFSPGMSWDNRGEWEVDHIIPYRVAKTKEHVFLLSYYKNTRPLWKLDNRRKGGKLCV